MSNLTNPLQSLISQASTLKDSGAAKKYRDRLEPSARKKVSSDSVLILDISGSMSELLAAGRKIDVLKKAVSPLLGQYKILTFNSSTQWIQTLEELANPSGGTALHLALAVAGIDRPRHTLVVSDGEPDDMRQAFNQAKKLTGSISTLYIGKDSDRKAIDFMAKLASIGCGQAHVQDLKVGHQALQQQIQRLLPGGIL